MTQSEIIAKVRLIMNEAGADQILSLLNEDSIKLDVYIEGCISDAVNFISSKSKFACVNKKSKSVTDSDIKINADGSGYVVLPEDYVSLIAFKMKDWSRVVVSAAMEGTEVAAAQSNKYTRAGKCKPVCVLTHNEIGRILEFYSVGEESSVSLFLYEARYSDGIPGGEQDPISTAVCYMCASLVYSIFENKITAEEMKAIAFELIPKE